VIGFVDTNIIAYARDRREPHKQRIAETWLVGLARSREGRLSWQVLIEYYAVATHPKKLGLTAESARADIRALQAWKPVGPDPKLLESAWIQQERHGFSWWDAMIVAAALSTGSEILLSEDLQHGLVVDNTLNLINPFAPNAPAPPAP